MRFRRGADCAPGAQVAAALADETNAPRRPLDEHPQYTFELVRHDPSLPAGRDAGCADYTASVVASAVKIFATSFAPLILDDGRDMCGCRAAAPPPRPR
jgi:hypothetical protein